MKILKTFNEFKRTPIQEATATQWARRGAVLGAALGAGAGMAGGAGAVTYLGFSGVAGNVFATTLPIVLSIWGAAVLGFKGLLAGALFAGGQARTEYAHLKKAMRRLEKYDRKEVKTESDDKRARKDIDEANYLVHRLRDAIDNELDLGTSKGILRRDIRSFESIGMDLNRISNLLKQMANDNTRDRDRSRDRSRGRMKHKSYNIDSTE